MATASINDSYHDLRVTETPFGNIGLAFSGGGFRAAAFCLGTLTMLNALEWGDEGTLLGNVTYISSASGGTITNAMYALSMAEGDSFNEFYRKISEQLQGTDLLTCALDILNNKSRWLDDQEKRRNIINAFALAYDKMLFDGKVLDNLKKAAPSSPLDEVCFNTSDFYRGLLFRQNIKMKADKDEAGFLYGNYILHLDHGTAGRIKLGDALASSACFPAGFEPMAFPADFANKDLKSATIRQNIHVDLQELKETELEFVFDKHEINKVKNSLPGGFTVQELKAELEKMPVAAHFETGFMDGGIDDNQGIESIMRANDRRLKKDTNFKPFDLMLINDVASHFMNPYKPAAAAKKFFSLRTLFWICIGAGLIGLGGLICNSHISCQWGRVLANVVSALLFVVPVSVIVVLWNAKRLVLEKVNIGSSLNLNKNFSEGVAQTFFRYLAKTPITVLINLLADRGTSVLTLNMDVFLKRIRYLLYNQFMEAGRATFTVKTNHVYDLSFSNDTNREGNSADPGTYAPTQGMQIVAQCAFEMGTTLWFDDKNDLNRAALIACGQFTTCYNLLVYISRMKVPGKPGEQPYFNSLSQLYQGRINKLEADLKAFYTKFGGDPFALYNQLGHDVFGNKFHAKKLDQYSFPKQFEGLRSKA